MNPIDIFIQRLDGLRGSNGRYQSKCPAHQDRSPSLSIKEAQDGRVLIHCHAGCEVSDVVESVGLTLGDLFPDDTRAKPIPQKQDFEGEKFYIDLARKVKAEGNHLDPITLNRVELAAHRIKTGRKLGVIT